MDVSLKLFFLGFSFFIVICDQSEVCFGLHTCINDLGKFFLIFLFDLIDLVPSIVFNLVSLLFVFLHHVLNIILQSVGLLNLLFKFNLLLLLEFLDDLFMMHEELIKSLLKLFSFFLLLSEQFLVAKGISLHLVTVVLLSPLQLNAMSLPHLLNLVRVHLLHVSLRLHEGFIPISILDFLVLNFHL